MNKDRIFIEDEMIVNLYTCAGTCEFEDELFHRSSSCEYNTMKFYIPGYLYTINELMKILKITDNEPFKAIIKERNIFLEEISSKYGLKYVEKNGAPYLKLEFAYRINIGDINETKKH